MPAPHHSFFTGRMPFLPPNQQRQSTEGIKESLPAGPKFTRPACHVQPTTRIAAARLLCRARGTDRQTDRRSIGHRTVSIAYVHRIRGPRRLLMIITISTRPRQLLSSWCCDKVTLTMFGCAFREFMPVASTGGPSICSIHFLTTASKE